MQPFYSTRNKSKYKDIYSLVERSWFTCDYVRELYQYTPKKFTIKVSNGFVSKRLYSISEMWLWIEVAEYIKGQPSNDEPA